MLMAVFAAVVVGSAMGSFVVAQVWRLRSRQLITDRADGEKVDKQEFKRLKPLSGQGLKKDRSRCLSCSEMLRWYDLVPIFSWLSLRGRCRYCGQPIGQLELWAELAMAVAFGLSVAFWSGPLDSLVEIIKLLVWMSALVVLAINFIYDFKWSLLVTSLNWLLIFLGLIFASMSIAQSSNIMSSIMSLLGGVAILGGLYAFLWLISRGRWVGEGDIYLGAGLALFLGDWRLSFVALFLANLIGVVAIIPGMIKGQIERGSSVPFGPLLILGFLVVWFARDFIFELWQKLVA